MKTVDLIKLLQENKPSNIKLESGISKADFINLLEARSSTADFMEMEANKEIKDGGYDTRRKTKEVETDKKVTKEYASSEKKEVTDKEKESPAKDEEPKKDNEDSKKQPLKITNDIGKVRIAFNDAFKNMTEDKYSTISNVFSMAEVKMIINTPLDKWGKLKRKLLIAPYDKYNDESKVIQFMNEDMRPDLPRDQALMRLPYAFVSEFYQPFQKLNDVKNNRELLALNAKEINETIYVLQLRNKKGRNRYAILVDTPAWDDKYVMDSSEKLLNFIYKSDGDIPMGTVPAESDKSNSAESTEDKADTDTKQDTNDKQEESSEQSKE
jgi:hypothetical protein